MEFRTDGSAEQFAAYVAGLVRVIDYADPARPLPQSSRASHEGLYFAYANRDVIKSEN